MENPAWYSHAGAWILRLGAKAAFAASRRRVGAGAGPVGDKEEEEGQVLPGAAERAGGGRGPGALSAASLLSLLPHSKVGTD